MGAYPYFFLRRSNPWTVLAEFDVHVDIGKVMVMVMHIRGGMDASSTGYVPDLDFPVWWDCPKLDEVDVSLQYRESVLDFVALRVHQEKRRLNIYFIERLR